MPQKSQFKMLDKTGTRFPTIREARLRAQWRENSKRYYAKKKLLKSLEMDLECATGSPECKPHMCKVCENGNLFYDLEFLQRTPADFAILKSELTASITHFYSLGEHVTDEEKDANSANVALLKAMLADERYAVGCIECMGGSFPKMCADCKNHNNFFTERMAWDAQQANGKEPDV